MSTTPKDRAKTHRAARRRKAKRRREDMLCRLEALMDRFERAVRQAELAASLALSRMAGRVSPRAGPPQRTGSSIMAMDDEDEDCALCGGPCTVAGEHGEATVTAADVARLEEIGVLKRVSPEEIAAFELRQREEMRLKYGTDDPTVCMRIVIQQLAEIAGLGSGRES